MRVPSKGRRYSLATALLLVIASISACNSDSVGPGDKLLPSGTILASDPRGEVYVIEASTGVADRLASGGEPIGPNNSKLGPNGDASGSNFISPREVRTVNLESRSVRRVFGYPPGALVGSTKISPDGSMMAISGLGLVSPDRFELVTIDLVTLQLTVRWSHLIEDGFLDLASVIWLPDQSGILALAVQSQGVRVAHLAFGTGSLDFLTEFIGQAIDPSLDLSPDGRVIAYSRPDGRTRFITFGGAPANGYPETLLGTYPAFSPDGRFVAFTKRDGAVPTILDGIWVHRLLDGQEWRLLPADSPITVLLDWE